jgi:hypothetical protein
MRYRVPALLLLLTTLTAACAEQSTAPRPAAPALNADFINNPDVGNGVVFRSGSEFAICWTDFSNGLRVCQRTQQFPVGSCGAFDPIGPVSEQEVVARPDQNDFFSSEVVVNEMGKMWITVRDLTQAGDCYGARRVAEGWGSFHYTDNDEFSPFNPGDKSTDTFGYMGQGALKASDGRTVNYSGHARYALHPDGTATAVEQVVRAH